MIVYPLSAARTLALYAQGLTNSNSADHAIDYMQEDFTKSGQHYDLTLEVNGYHPILDYRRPLSPMGMYVGVGVSRTHLFQGLFQGMLLRPLISKIKNQRFVSMGITKLNQEDLIFLKELLEIRKIVPVIDRCYRLMETAEALRYIGEGHARGKIIITME